MKKLASFFAVASKSKHKQWQQWLLVGLLAIAAILRLYKLGAIPTGLNRDETSLGYTAYALLSNGTDERGVAWPVNVKSFGDWKLGGYVYSLLPAVSVFGLSEWVVRLPSAMAGIASIGLIYLIVAQLLKLQTESNKAQPKSGKKSVTKKWLPLTAAALLTFSPWHLHVSRVAYESNLALALLMTGIYLFLLGIRKHYWLLVASSLFVSATLLTYHSYQVFAPLFGLFLLFSFRKSLQKAWKLQPLPIALAIAIPFCIIGLLIFTNSQTANTIKFSGLSIFSRQHYASVLFEQRQRFPATLQAAAIVYANSGVLIGQQLVSNLLSITSTGFLFLNGGSHPTHHIPGLGLLHWFEAVSLVIGLYWFNRERESWQKIIFGWLVLAMIPALITFEATHPIRFLAGVAPLAIISGYGLGKAASSIHSKWQRKIIIQRGFFFVGLVCVFYSVFYALSTYFIQFPKTGQTTWPWYMKQLVTRVWSIKDQYDVVIFQGESASPYIYFLFYNQLNPVELVTRMSYYPETEEGFEHVKQLDSIRFETAIWTDFEGRSEKILIVLLNEEIPGDKFTKADYQVIDTISSPDSEVQFTLLEYD